jgi:hypothetical protein
MQRDSEKRRRSSLGHQKVTGVHDREPVRHRCLTCSASCLRRNVVHIDSQLAQATFQRLPIERSEFRADDMAAAVLLVVQEMPRIPNHDILVLDEFPVEKVIDVSHRFCRIY